MPRKWTSIVLYTLVYQLLAVDLVSSSYGIAIASGYTPSSLVFWALFIAKWHGFAVNLCLTFLLLSVMRNAQRWLRCNVPVAAYSWMARMQHALGCEGYNSHMLYGWRAFLSGLVHTLAHATVTHPFRPVYDPLTLQVLPLHGRIAFYVGAWFADILTWTGYAILSAFVLGLIPTGQRLWLRLARHWFVYIVHRFAFLLLLALFFYHHPFVAWPAAWLLLYALDATLGRCLYTRDLAVVATRYYPHRDVEHACVRDDVIELAFVADHLRDETPRAGDYVRVQVPQISRFEWHDFTVTAEHRSHNDPAIRRLAIRSVGRWTKQLYLLGHVHRLRLTVKGPYNLELHNPLLDSFDKDRKTDLSILRVVVVCTGTAITYAQSAIEPLLAMYQTSSAADRFLPAQLVLVWMVRSVFDLNYGILTLDRYQRLLEARGFPDTLLYEFYVTRRPNATEDMYARSFRQMLLCALVSGRTMRNSRLSALDLVGGKNVRAELGRRFDYEDFERRHLADGRRTLVVVNSSVTAVREQLRRLARKNGAAIHVDGHP